MRRSQKGFTLMELMVVIVIVAILAAVAVPLYLNYVKDAQRTEARGAIGAAALGRNMTAVAAKASIPTTITKTAARRHPGVTPSRDTVSSGIPPIPSGGDAPRSIPVSMSASRLI